jgi:diguanylate cyclase (GGDEF)-like protein/PAS domain S-box-containing protein
MPDPAFLGDQGWNIIDVDEVERRSGIRPPGDPGSYVLAFSFSDSSGLLGSFTLIDPTCRDWTEHETTTLQSIARVLGQLHSRMVAERALDVRRSSESMLAELAADLVHVTTADAGDVVATWLERVRAQNGSTSIAVWELDATVPQLVCRSEATASGRPVVAEISPIPWRHRAISAVEASADMERWRVGDLMGEDVPLADASVLLFPVVHDRDVIALTVVDSSGEEFADDTVTAFRSIAALLGQLRRRLVLERSAERRRQADRLLRDIASDLLDRPSAERDEATFHAFAELGEFLGSPLISRWTKDEQEQMIRCSTMWGLDADEVESKRDAEVSAATPFAMMAAGLDMPIVVPLADSPESDLRDRDVIVAPIRHAGVVKSVIMLSLPVPAEEIRDLDLCIEVIGSAAMLLEQLDSRLAAEDEVVRRLEMEDTLARFATRLIETPVAVLDGTRSALEELVSSIGVDHASFWRTLRTESTFELELVLDVHRGDVRPIPESDWRRVVAVPADVDSSWGHALGSAVDTSIDEIPDSAGVVRGVTPDGPRRVAIMVMGEGEGGLSTFVVSRPGTEPFDAHEIRLLRSAAGTLAQHEVRIAAQRWFVAAFDSAPVAISMRDHELTLISCNAAYEELLGRTEAEMLGKGMEGLISMSAEETRAAHEEALGGQSEHEAAYLRPDGTVRFAEVRSIPVVVPGRRGSLILTYVDDVTEQRRSRELLEFQATHDELTGLPNRRALVAEIERELEANRDCAVLVLDHDRFKVVNDSLGHSAGDQLLVTGADRIRLSLRPGDVVARLGGDEFAILLRSPADTTASGAVANRLLSLLREPANVGGHEVFSSASIGIAIPEAGDTVEDLLRHADAAMYESKSRGRDRWETFDHSMREAVAQRIGMESDLRRAIDNGQLETFYQPEVMLTSGEIVGVEALVRWHHPEKGLLTAGAFVGLAEESGLVVDIGRWVIREATRQGAEWRGQGHDIVMRVNLSARQLRPAIVDDVGSALTESGLDPTALCLEITETAIMDDVEESERILLRFRELGVQVAVDDFGTGFSSLAYLKRFPVDILKIDRTFVDGVGVDADDTAIVQSVIGLARTLRLEVVAEGIEDANQLAELVRLGCDRGQGFHLARPAPAHEVGALLGVSLLG